MSNRQTELLVGEACGRVTHPVCGMVCVDRSDSEEEEDSEMEEESDDDQQATGMNMLQCH